MLPHCPRAFPTLFILAMQIFRGRRYGCPCQDSLGRLEDVITSVFPGLPATQNLQILCFLCMYGPQQASELLENLELQHLEDPHKLAHGFIQLKKIDLISGRLTSNTAVKLPPLSAATFSSAPFSFPSSGVIFVSGSKVAMVVQVLFREGQECSHENSLSFAFQWLHSWGFPVTK